MLDVNLTNTLIVFHCVPHGIEKNIEIFWSLVRKKLLLNGKELLLISTTSIEDKTLPVINIPFILMEFNDDKLKLDFSNDHVLINQLMNWYMIDKKNANKTLISVDYFFKKLIDGLNPFAVISWNSAHPLSRIIRHMCLENDIPWWTAERGWINKTLMFDICENNYLSEFSRSFAIQRMAASYKPSLSLKTQLEERFSTFSEPGRYPPKSKIENNFNIRKRYSISDEKLIWTFFAHGEPHVHAMSKNIQNNHMTDRKLLKNQLIELSKILKCNNSILLIKEHPLNFINATNLEIDNDNIILFDGDLNEIYKQTDVALFTLSTLQFQWAYENNKPFGLLARSLLSGDNMAPQLENHINSESFIIDILNYLKCNKRVENIKNRISFLYEYLLVDISDYHMNESVSEFVEMLSKFSVKIDAINV